jgi:transglutaminase-like putative cysteine protease
MGMAHLWHRQGVRRARCPGRLAAPVMTVRLLRRLFSADVLGLIVVLVALQAFVYGLGSSLRTTDTSAFFWVCLLAALIGFGLSKRNLNGIPVAVGMILLGLIGVWILGARLTGPLLEVGKAILDVLPEVRPAIRAQTSVDTTAIAERWMIVMQASSALSMRVQTWLFSQSQNGFVNDPLMRNLVWVFILWLVAAWMGWFARRRNAMAALLPCIILLAIILSYSEYRVEALWTIVVSLLLLMGIWNYRNHTERWESKKVDYSDSIRYDSSQAVIFLSLILGAVAFITPSISWREVRDFLRERDRGKSELAETLGVQQKPAPVQHIPLPKPTLPRDHLLSGGYAHSQQIVMIVRTGELVSILSPDLPPEAPRHYWRSTTYDTYVGAGWVTSSAPSQTHQPNTPLIPGLLNGYQPLHMDVEMVEPEGKLFWSGTLFSADVPLKVNWRLRPASYLFADQSSLLQADIFSALTQERVYRAEAYLPLVTVEELRTASTEYPQSIRDRYLQLPTSVPGRVLELAQQLTNGKQTAYDKVKAIEAYLRTYPYDLEVLAPPPDRDVADYFLFELKKGYCDYYATAMVVLARASGLPARFVSGYAPGSYDISKAAYVVRELHAHSWVEIYFPQIGWIEFEPTSAQPEIEIPPSSKEVVNAQPDETATRLLNRFRLETLLYWGSPLAIVILSLLLYFTWIERWLYMRLAPAVAIEKIYRQLYRWGRPLAGERTTAETAHEFMGKFSDRIQSIERRSRFGRFLFRARHDVRLLTELYQDSLFAHYTLDAQASKTALDTWKYLRLRLLLARLSNFMNRVIPRRAKQPGQRNVASQ